MNTIKEPFYTEKVISDWDRLSVIHISNLAKKIADFFLELDIHEIKMIDIGSNTGQMIKQIEKHGVKVEEALLVEPIHELIEYSKRKFYDRNYEYMNFCLSDHDGEVSFVLSENINNLGASRIWNETNDNCRILHQYKFDNLSFDRFVPDLIKIDAEGSDDRIIKGMFNFLNGLRKKPVIVFETTGYDAKLPDEKRIFNEVREELTRIGYKTYKNPKNSIDILTYIQKDIQ